MTLWRSQDSEHIERDAIAWTIRKQRGLTSTEAGTLTEWLAVDTRHTEALARCEAEWRRFDLLSASKIPAGSTPDPDLFSPARAPRPLAWIVPVSLAAAAAIAIGFYLSHLRTFTLTSLTAPCEERTLADGSMVELNRGAVIETQFTANERRVHLVKGEGHFAVAKDAAHLFIVSAGGAEFVAVGTAFDVRMGQHGVDLLVTEGKVKVMATQTPDHPKLTNLSTAPVVEAGQRTTVYFATDQRASSMLNVTPIAAKEREDWLAWKPRLLVFTNQPLPDIVAQLNQHNPVHLIVADPDLSNLHLTASLRSDNVDGFLRLLESHFSVRCERKNFEILLYRVSS